MGDTDVTVSIRVTGTDRRPIPKAKVSLLPVGAKRGTALTFDEVTSAYTGAVRPGEYVVRAAAKGLRGEEHVLRVQPTGASDTVVLGADGLPAYYLGQVRVPFEPLEGLVALTLDGRAAKRGDDAEGRVVSIARDLGMEPVEVPDEVTRDNVRVFRAEAGAVDDVLARLAQTDGVDRAGPVLHLDGQSVTYLTDELVVRFRDVVEAGDVAGIAREFGLRVDRPIPYAGNAFLLKAERASFELLDVLERLVDSELVDYAEPNLVVTAVPDFTPDDPRFDEQPHHGVIGSEAAWDITTGTNTITIAVMDDGCEIGHADFQNPVGSGWTKIVNAFDFTSYDANPTSGSHGTRSCGIAAAVLDNATGVAGMAGGCRLMPLRWPGGGTLVQYSDAYVWAAGFDPSSTTPGFPAVIAANPADVISNSFGRSEAAMPAIMKDTFDYLTTYGRGGRGCVVVFSTGNDSLDFTTYRQWAAYERTIAVGSSRISPPDAAEVKVSTSNFGSKIDVCAPGGGPGGGTETRTMSTTDFSAYSTHGQTSCACPQVAGTAALMLSANPALTWTQVRHLLRTTAVRIDSANVDPGGQYVDNDGDGVAEFSQWYGYGRLNAAAAVSGADTFAAPYDVVVRDNLADTGASVPVAGAFWNSPDIWVRQTDPGADPGAIPANYGTAGPTEPGKAGQDNWVYVRLRNRGAGASLPFYVRVYLAHFAGTEFVYPANFVPSNNPGTAPTPPLAHGTYLIGEVAHAALGGGAESIVNVVWPQALVPPETVMVGGMPASWHPCLLVEVSPHDGPGASGNHVWDDNNLAQKNISIDYTDDGDDSSGSFIVVGNAENHDDELVLVVDRGRLPRDVELSVRFADERVAKRVRARLDGDRDRPARPDGVRVELLDEGRLDISSATGRLLLKVPGGTLLESLLPETRTVDVLSRRPAWEGDRLRLPYTRRVRIPVPVRPGELVGIVVGAAGGRQADPGGYHVVVGQQSPGGGLTGAAGVEVRVGKRNG